MPSGQPHQRVVLDESYTAVIRVDRYRRWRQANGNGYFDDGEKKETDELAAVTVKSDTLEGLILKIKQHADLVSDD